MKDFENRAGRYITQPAGYRAFIPAPLPPDPPVHMSEGDIQVLLSRADRSLGRLDGSIQTLPNPDMFVYMYMRKEAVLSSQIEGTQSSLNDLIKAEASVGKPDPHGDVSEVINYVSAMNYGLERLEKIPLSICLIREIHARLLEGSRGSNLMPGDLRTRQNWIGPSGCKLNEAIFVPPPPETVPEHLSGLEKFLHTDTDMPLLIKTGLVHSQFETIHPFLDGNGRVGRLLITFLLCQREVLLKPVLYLSLFFKQNQQQYYQELQSVREQGTWERWLEFFLRGVVDVSEQATETARLINNLREQHRNLIAQKFGYAAGKGHLVLEHLYRNPIVSVGAVRDLVGKTSYSYMAANQLVKRMVDCGILLETTGQTRNRRFIYQQYIDLFEGSEDRRQF